ncbi:MAG: ABC transporter ATP-binding protein/permease [Acetobacter sp.]|nr:ABC transporter ATP-binding protein/permease [Bacteroides sp.]MCM1340857.1 ABC transporter ATP-binding protein/permease [Acetobacter sp.]MCM1432586.1 ABC transporter ATP-binding protein/permease [Clostridiales bacterium]
MKNNIKYMLSNWLKWDRKSLLFFWIRVPALVLQPIITAYIPKAIIDCINQGVTTERLVLVIALLSLLLTFTIWMDPFMSELIRGGARIVRMRYAVMAFQKNLKTDYVNIENLEKREIQKRAEDFYGGRWSGGASFIDTCNQFCVCVIGVITSSFLIYKINVLMILLIIATCVCQFFLLKLLNRKIRENLDSRSKFRTRFDYFYKMSKNTTAAKDIRLYGFQDYFIKALADSLFAIEKIISKYTHQAAAFDAVTALLNLIREAVAYAYLIYLVTKGILTVSEFVFYFGIITGFSNWIVNLVYSYSQIERCCNECAAYRKYIETKDSSQNGEDFKDEKVDSIVFNNVSFRYPSAENDTLKNINLEFKNGENIAIVGENGAGKTTLIKLLCGLYNSTGGEILVNSKNTALYSKDSYFDLFSAIFQDYYFLPMTIAQNITADINYDKEKLYSAFEKAGISDKINTLENKENSLMDKEVYKDAVDFSGGEKQKLLLAKAIYKNAPVLILDEPTAALDPIAENELYLKYSELTKDKLSFFISHRLSSTRFCDRIIFISDGQIAEQGTHEELMALKGAYYKMYQIQSYYYKEHGVSINE